MFCSLSPSVNGAKIYFLNCSVLLGTVSSPYLHLWMHWFRMAKPCQTFSQKILLSEPVSRTAMFRSNFCAAVRLSEAEVWQERIARMGFLEDVDSRQVVFNMYKLYNPIIHLVRWNWYIGSKHGNRKCHGHGTMMLMYDFLYGKRILVGCRVISKWGLEFSGWTGSNQVNHTTSANLLLTQNGWENYPRFFQFWGGLGRLFHSDLGTDWLEGAFASYESCFWQPFGFS